MSAAASSAAATAALLASQSARRSECATVTKGFQNDWATVEEKREYASCIRALHPESMSGGEIVAAKVLIVLCIASAVAGLVIGKREGGWGDGLLAAFLLPLITGMGGICLWLAFKGVRFVFSGEAA